MKIAVIGGIPESLELFRGALIERMIRAGHDVTALAGYELADVSTRLHRRGAAFQAYPLARTQTNPLQDIRTFWFLYRWMRREKPDLVFSYTIKPVVWGGLAARLAGVPVTHALITGLGNQFSTDQPRQRMLTRVIQSLYRLALRGATTVTFQNADDREALISRGLVAEARTFQVHGSGVDLSQFPNSPLPDGRPTFLCISRLLAAKGLREYVAAAEKVKATHPQAVFQLAGMEEQGAAAIPLAEVQSWHDAGTIEFLGRVPHARRILDACHVYVLPSYYGEGLPRTILEALAIGRPVITTDNVGCRDAVNDGVNGLIVPPRDIDALAQSMRWCLDHPEVWPTMAGEGRALAEARYDVHRVNASLFEIMGLDNATADS